MVEDLSQTRRGYPLSALFGLVAACAIILALVAPIIESALEQEFGVEPVVVAILVGGLVTVCLGMIVGGCHYRRLFGVSLGGLVGLFLGPLIGMLTLIPITAGNRLFCVMIGGSVILVGLGAFMRLTQRDGDDRRGCDLMDEPPIEAEIVDDPEQVQRVRQ